MAEALRIARTSETERSRFLGRTYGWMGFALLISGIAAYFTSKIIYQFPLGTPDNVLSPFGAFLFGPTAIGSTVVNAAGFWIFAIAEIVIVLVLSARIRKMSVAGAAFGFILYALLNGMTLSSIFIVYNAFSIVSAFLGTSVTFFIMCFWGHTTKKNLATFGRYMVMGLMGIIITNFIGWLLARFSGVKLVMLDYVIMIASVIVFSGLAAWDSQKVAKTAANARNNDDYKKVSIIAALELYLDFINLFLVLLRLFGRGRD